MDEFLDLRPYANLVISRKFFKKLALYRQVFDSNHCFIRRPLLLISNEFDHKVISCGALKPCGLYTNGLNIYMRFNLKLENSNQGCTGFYLVASCRNEQLYESACRYFWEECFDEMEFSYYEIESSKQYQFHHFYNDNNTLYDGSLL